MKQIQQIQDLKLKEISEVPAHSNRYPFDRVPVQHLLVSEL